ncbi:hypothetical protein [Aeromonas hydrophila]|uniref:Uncharacterized protein n=1 Tax=Aeromonas hydrophila TaxID=644 RepID=A0AAX3PC77_AERHY|nr:hypothetical protein [Aeromonas hydrophila]WEE28319.1 hypothetical protein PY771_08375 [Aeromonas hydrophila]
MEFTLNDISKITGRSTVVKYGDWDFHLKTPNSTASTAYDMAGFKLTSSTTAAERENILNSANKILLMGSMCDARGELLFKNEKEYKAFIQQMPTFLIDELISSAVELRLSDAEKKASSEPSTLTESSKTES